MISYENSTTRKLRARARKLGLQVEICISPDNSASRYFIYFRDEKPLSNWISLGWTQNEATEALRILADSMDQTDPPDPEDIDDYRRCVPSARVRNPKGRY